MATRTSQTEPAVTVDVDAEGIAVITLNRPGALNAVNPEVAVRLMRAYTRVREYVSPASLVPRVANASTNHRNHSSSHGLCAWVVCSDPSISVAILTGTGRAFCAGADLKRLISLSNGSRTAEDEWDRAYLETSPDWLLRSFDIGKVCGHVQLCSWLVCLDGYPTLCIDPTYLVWTVQPLIAAINGFAVAGGTSARHGAPGCNMLTAYSNACAHFPGMELVQATDLRVAVSKAKFGLQEPKWGLFPLGGSTVRLPRQVRHGLCPCRCSRAPAHACCVIGCLVLRL